MIDVKSTSGCYGDAGGRQQIFECSVLWEKEVPSWLGGGRVYSVPDTILTRLQ